MTEKAISTLTYFNTSKVGIQQFVDKVITELEAGQINPLDLLIYLKSIEKSIEGINQRAKEMINNEADKYSEKSIEYKGARIDKAELGVKYDYAMCEDREWNIMTADINTLTYKRKKREEFLKALINPIDWVDVETGEIITIYPPIKSSTTGLKVTIK